MPTPSYGVNAWIGFGDETTWGTAVSRTDYLEQNNSSLDPEIRYGFRRKARGIAPSGKYTQFSRGNGTVSFDLLYEGYLLLFKHLLGGSATTDITTGQSYRHTFDRASALPAGLTIEEEKDAQNFLYTGGRIAQATLRFPAGEVPELELQVATEDAIVNQTVSTPTFPTERLILPVDGSVTLSSTNITSADFASEIVSVAFTVTNSLDTERQRIGSTSPKEFVRSSTRAETTISLEFSEQNTDTDNFVEEFVNQNTLDLTLQMQSSTTIGTSSDQYTLKIEAPTCVINSAPTPVQDPGAIPLSLELLALETASASFDIDDGTDTDIKVTVDNSESAI